MQARRATEDEEARIWPKFVAGLSNYATYRRRTTRAIPVIILAPLIGARGAAGL
ncbi:MAG: nitroreductase/quinone reductase family protein [Candidatus Limnocylindria bacterium]